MRTYYARRGCWFGLEVDRGRFVAVGGCRIAGESGQLDLSRLMGQVPHAELYRRAYRWAKRRGWVRRSWCPAWLSRWLDQRRAR